MITENALEGRALPRCVVEYDYVGGTGAWRLGALTLSTEGKNYVESEKFVFFSVHFRYCSCKIMAKAVTPFRSAVDEHLFSIFGKNPARAADSVSKDLRPILGCALQCQ